MKFHKLMSRTVMATALLGATVGGAFSSINASAAIVSNSNNNTPIAHVTKGHDFNVGSKIGMHIDNNSLELDSVPKLNFGDSANTDHSRSGSNTLPLNSNNDQNDSGLLEVSDYRLGSSNAGWSLSASMDQVNPDEGTQNDQNIDNDWKIQLNNNNTSNSVSQANFPIIQSSYTLSNITGGTSQSGDSLNNMNISSTGNNSNAGSTQSSNNNNGYGVNKIIYNDPRDAMLTIPNVAPGNYTTNINWTLSSSVDEGSNSF